MKVATDFKHLTCSGYMNINSIAEITDRLHCSETLFGDRNANVMVLGQDGAPFETFRKLVDIEGASGFRHGPEVQTNKNLVDCLSDYLKKDPLSPAGFSAKTCGVYYANAVWLLKTSSGMAGVLPKKQTVMRECKSVFEATLDGLEHLKCIITLGRVPYEFISLIDPSLDSDWRKALTSPPQKVSLFKREVFVGAALHPSPLSGGKKIHDLKKRFDSVLVESGVSPLPVQPVRILP